MEGWIKLHRRITEWEWYDDSNTFRLFIHLLLKATHKPIKWQNTELIPGQLITGRKVLAEQLKLTEREIRTSITRLKTTNEIAIKTTNKFSIITVCNWEDYQQIENTERPTKRPTERPTGDQQTTTYKKDKTNKEVKNNTNAVQIYPFEDFWNDYGKKIDMSKCETKWNKISDSDRILIKSHLPEYKKSTPDIKFRKNPLTFLNGSCWNDTIIDQKNSDAPERIGYGESYINGKRMFNRIIEIPKGTRPCPNNLHHWNTQKKDWVFGN